VNSEPLLLATPSGEALELRPEGPWTAANVGKLEALSRAVRADVDRSKLVRLDMAGVSDLDTLGAWLLEKLSRGAHRRPPKAQKESCHDVRRSTAGLRSCRYQCLQQQSRIVSSARSVKGE